jgi:hypothetical protein
VFGTAPVPTPGKPKFAGQAIVRALSEYNEYGMYEYALASLLSPDVTWSFPQIVQFGECCPSLKKTLYATPLEQETYTFAVLSEATEGLSEPKAKPEVFTEHRSATLPPMPTVAEVVAAKTFAVKDMDNAITERIMNFFILNSI